MKIGIIGIGLIGGSMALDLRQRGFASKILGVDNNPEHLEIAQVLGIIDEPATLEEVTQKCEVIVVSTPVDVAPKVVATVLDMINDRQIVLDVGSTKEFICGHLQKHAKRKQFVACHPIAGTEMTGPRAAQHQLFDHKVNIICNPEQSSEEARRLVKDLFDHLKMEVIEMDAQEHDRHIAFVSHLSHITSFALSSTVLKIEKDEKSIFNMAGSGFASTVRLAKSSPEMWAPIFTQNAGNISMALEAYIEQLMQYKEVVDEGMTGEAYDMIANATQIKRILEGIELKNRERFYSKPKVKKAIKPIEPLENWLPGLNRPLVISGPCSAETEGQTLETCRQLAETGKVDVLRAGIWKPRTRPNTFEGVGTVGLKWLKKAKEQTGLKTAVEVANARHVEEALKYDVDILWLGARTTVNPFSVQEIADALDGLDIPVLIKNPINADLELWIGAIERVQGAGISKIGAIHRGFSRFGEKQYRNAPQWQIPIELKRRMPDIPIICDPSHIGGTRELIAGISQQAMDLNFEGLMIESHITPDKALSDAKQQVTPVRLKEIIDDLVLRREMGDLIDPDKSIDKLRNKIDEIDAEILNMLSQRMNVAGDIGRFKKQNQVTILQTSRWNDIYDKNLKKGEELGLGKEFIERYLKAVHQESINHQNRIMNTE
ncbi:MAG: prephenate dehydrogenase [Candidatus Cyclobacteriaceae bacterium M2_1C_046]